MALAVTPGKALINSVSGEQNRLNQLLPLVKEYGAAIIALCMDDAGIPDSPKGRLTVAEKILEGGAKLGIPPEDFILDPLVMSVGADTRRRDHVRDHRIVASSIWYKHRLGSQQCLFWAA